MIQSVMMHVTGFDLQQDQCVWHIVRWSSFVDHQGAVSPTSSLTFPEFLRLLSPLLHLVLVDQPAGGEQETKRA